MKKQKIFSGRHKIFYSILTQPVITISIQLINIKEQKIFRWTWLIHDHFKQQEYWRISHDRQKIVCWKYNRKTHFNIGSFNIKKLATENVFYQTENFLLDIKKSSALIYQFWRKKAWTENFLLNNDKIFHFQSTL